MSEHFLSLADHPAERLNWLLGVAAEVKEAPAGYANSLRGHFFGMLMPQPSARDHASFAVGGAQLGCSSLSLQADTLHRGDGDSLSDVARALSGYLDCVVVGMPEQTGIETLAAAVSIPVINARSDLLDPCQAVADFFTLRESFNGRIDGLRLAYVGVGRGICHSILLGGALLGVSVAVATRLSYGNSRRTACTFTRR